MRLQSKKTKSLTFDPRNARTHSRENIEAIKESLQRFGQQKPIVIDSKDTVIAGNGTLQAALELGWEKIQVVRSDLDAKQLEAFALADNRTAELAGWDEEILLSILEDIPQEMESLGFDADFLEALSEASRHLDDFDEDPEVEEHDTEEKQAKLSLVASKEKTDKEDTETSPSDESLSEGKESASEEAAEETPPPLSTEEAKTEESFSIPPSTVSASVPSREVTIKEPPLGSESIAEELDAKALADMRRREQLIALGMEIHDREGSLSSVETFRFSTVFNDDRAAVVKAALGDDPSSTIYNLCYEKLEREGRLQKVLRAYLDKTKEPEASTTTQDDSALDEALSASLAK